jgi:hypothetical protein
MPCKLSISCWSASLTCGNSLSSDILSSSRATIPRTYAKFPPLHAPRLERVCHESSMIIWRDRLEESCELLLPLMIDFNWYWFSSLVVLWLYSFPTQPRVQSFRILILDATSNGLQGPGSSMHNVAFLVWVCHESSMIIWRDRPEESCELLLSLMTDFNWY